MTFEIETREVPPIRRRDVKFPLDKLQINENNSFFVPVDGYRSRLALQNSLVSSIVFYRKRHGGKFITRREGNGVRVYRIE